MYLTHLDNKVQLTKKLQQIKKTIGKNNTVNPEQLKQLELTNEDIDLLKFAHEQTRSSAVNVLSDFIANYLRQKIWSFSFEVAIDVKNLNRMTDEIYRIFERNEKENTYKKIRLKELNNLDEYELKDLTPNETVYIEVYFKAQGFLSEKEILKKFKPILNYIDKNSIDFQFDN